MGERRTLLRRRFRRRPFGFWAMTFYVAMWPFCQAAGTVLFQISWWMHYGVWLPMPTSEYFDGKPFYHPDTPWVVAHPVLKVIFPIPISITSALLGMMIVGSMLLLDDHFGSGWKTRKIRFRPPEDVERC